MLLTISTQLCNYFQIGTHYFDNFLLQECHTSPIYHRVISVELLNHCNVICNVISDPIHKALIFKLMTYYYSLFKQRKISLFIPHRKSLEQNFIARVNSQIMSPILRLFPRPLLHPLSLFRKINRCKFCIGFPSAPLPSSWWRHLLAFRY